MDAALSRPLSSALCRGSTKSAAWQMLGTSPSMTSRGNPATGLQRIFVVRLWIIRDSRIIRLHGRQVRSRKRCRQPTKARAVSSLRRRDFEDDNHLIIPSIRQKDGEERFKVVGCVGEKLFTGVFTWRSDVPRFMSVRRSNSSEERAYHSSF